MATRHCCLLIVETCINAALWYHETQLLGGGCSPPDQILRLKGVFLNMEKPRGAYKLCNAGSTNGVKHQVCSGRCHTHQAARFISYRNLPRDTLCHLSRESSTNPSNLGAHPASPVISAPGATRAVTHHPLIQPPKGKAGSNLQTSTGPGKNLCRVSKLRVRFLPPHPYPPALPVLYPSPCIPRSCVLRENIYCVKDPGPFFLAWKAYSIVALLGYKSI